VNPDQLKFITEYDGPTDEVYFQRLRELDGSQSAAEVAERAGESEETGATPIRPSAERWEDPVPLSPVATLPSFPTAALPDWVRDYVEAEAIAVQVPVDMSAMFALGMLATVAGGRVEVQPDEGWLEGVNLFIVVAMEPGSRKSAAHRDMSAPILEFERLLAEQVRPDVAEQASIRRIAEQSLGRAEKSAASAKDNEQRREREEDAKQAAAALERLEVPVAPRLFTSDATPEALASLLHENRGRIAILSAEAGVFGVMAGRYGRGGSPNLDVYLAGHAGDPIRVDRRGRPQVPHPRQVAEPKTTASPPRRGRGQSVATIRPSCGCLPANMMRRPVWTLVCNRSIEALVPSL
jgi:hypothetical protein